MNDIDIRSRFFYTGGALPPESPSYIPRSADEQLFERLLHGDYCYVLVSRQMGKSSLMVHTLNRLVQRNITAVMVDLNSIGDDLTQEQWYYSLAEQLAGQLGLIEEIGAFWDRSEGKTALQKWVGAVEQLLRLHTDRSLVVFIDEIDQVRSLPFKTDEFFAVIRSFHNRRATDADFKRLAFCLIGVALPSDLIEDPRITPFNIAERIDMTDFTEEQVVALKAGLQRDEVQEEVLLERVFYWTNGHPYLTQRLCRAIVEDQSVQMAPDVDRLCGRLFFGADATVPDDNINFVSSCLLHSDPDVVGLLTLYQRIVEGKSIRYDKANRLINILMLVGAIRSVGGNLQIRNRIYSQFFDAGWIAANLPQTEWMRHQAAYRRGVLRTAAVSLLILAGMGGLTWAAIHNAGIADGNARIADSNARLYRMQKHSAEESARQARTAETRENRAASELLSALHAKSAALLAAEQAKALAQTRAGQVRQALLQEHWQLSQSQAERGIALLNRGEGRGMFDLLDAWASADDFPALQAAQGRVWQGWYAAYARDLVRVVGLPQNIVGFAAGADGNLIALATFDHRVWIYDVAAGKLRDQSLPQPNAITMMTLSPDGTRLACSLLNQHLTIWNVATGALVRETSAAPESRFYAGHEGPRDRSGEIPPPPMWAVTDMAFSPDSKRLLVATGANGGGCVDIYDPQTGIRRKYSACTCGSSVCRIAISPDSRQMLLLYGDWKSLRRVNLEALDASSTTGTLTPQVFPEEPFFPETGLRFSDATFSPDSRKFAAWDSQNRMYVFDPHVSRNRAVKTLDHPDEIEAVAWAPDNGTLVASCRNGDVLFWDTGTWSRKIPSFHVSDLPGGLAFAPDGSQLAIVVGNGILRCDTHLGGPVRVSLLPSGMDRPHFLSRSGILACCAGSLLRLYRATPAENVLSLARGHAMSAVLSPNGDRVVTAQDNSTAQVWDAATGHTIGPPLRHEAPVVEAFFTRDGRRIVTRAGRHLVLWDAITGKRLWETPGQSDPIYSVYLSPDGKRLVTASGVKKVHCSVQQWETATGKPIGPARHQREMAYDMDYSPDGMLLAVEDGPVVRLWAAGTMQITGRVLRHDGDVRSIGFAPDGKRLLTASEDGSARLWDVATGRQITVPMTHQDHVLVALFSPDGTRIATGSADRTVRFWDARTGAPLGAPLQAGGPIAVMAFRPDGKTMAISCDNVIQLWDVETCQPIGPPLPQGSGVDGLAFHPDGRQILAILPKVAARLVPLPSGSPPNLAVMSQETQRVLGIHRDRQGRQSRLLSTD